MTLSDLLIQINDLKEELDDLSPIPEESKRLLDKKFRLEFNYNSNHIEGNTLTYGETELLLILKEARGSHPFRDLEEMKASDVTFEMINQLAREKEQPLTEFFIKSLNRILLVEPYWKDAVTADNQTTKRKITIGDYKKFPNSVRLSNGEIFDYASPVDTPILMAELINWLRNEEERKEIHPVEIAALLHYKFVRIHPFDDGNGRISRLLMNYILIKNGFPPVIIKADDKKKYLSALRDADVGDIDSFKRYIADQLIWSLEISLKAAKNETIDEGEDWKKKAALIKKELSDKDSIKITKSNEVVLDLINSKILPFAFDTLNELTEFDDLFLRKRIYYWVNGNRIPISKDQIIDNDSFRFLKNSIQLSLYFEDFTKDANDPFGIDNSLKFNFFTHKYDVYLNDNAVFTKLYHQQFTKADNRDLINTIGEYVVSIIEKRILDRLQ